MTHKNCPYCGAKYPDCGPECYNSKLSELVPFLMGLSVGRDVPDEEMRIAWNTRAELPQEKP